MRSKLAAVAAGVFAITFAATTAGALDLSILPGDLAKRAEALIETRFPPELKSVTLDPAEPEAGSPTAITAEVYNDASVTSDETSEVFALYSTDGGGTWESVELESDDSKTWTGELPAFESGTEVVYSIRAKDSSENVMAVIPCKVDGAAIVAKDYVDADCVNGDGDCSSVLPRTCMMKIAVDTSDDSAEYPDYGEIEDMRMGFDDTSFYFDITMKGKIGDGTINPMDIRLVGGVLANVDKGDMKTQELESLVNAGGIMTWAPQAAIAGSQFGAAKCAFITAKGSDANIDDKVVKCKKLNNHLFFTLDREAIGENPSNTIQFASITGAVNNINPPNGEAYDNTHFSQVKYSDEEFKFTVK